jgi:hypothetical protein
VDKVKTRKNSDRLNDKTMAIVMFLVTEKEQEKLEKIALYGINNLKGEEKCQRL